MALFKILNNFQSKNNLPNTSQEGYCYFDITTNLFWIDIATTPKGTTLPADVNSAAYRQYRVPLNAYAAKGADVAARFTTEQTVELTGDVTGEKSSTAGWSIATTLKNSGVTAGNYGPSAAATIGNGGNFTVPYFTVDAKGRVTAAASKTITLPTITLAGLVGNKAIGSATKPVYWDGSKFAGITSYEGNAASANKVNHSLQLRDSTRKFDGSADVSLLTNDLAPAIHKKYESTNYYATSSGSWETSTWYFMSVKPNNWYEPWSVHFRVKSYCPGASNVISDTDSIISGRANDITYHNWHECYDHGHYYLTRYLLTQTGFNAGYGHAIGVSILYGTNYTTASYYRTFEVDYYDCQNCTVTLLDTPVKWANWVGTGSTNYGSLGSMNASSRGLQESGDNDSTGYYILSNGFRLTAGSNGIGRYTLFGQTTDGTYESLTITKNSTATTKAKNTKGFLPTGKLYWNSNGTDYASGAVSFSPYEQYHSIDYRYTFNISTTGLPASCHTYVVWTYDAANKALYLADNWLATSLPTTDDGKIYQRIGSNYYASAEYRGSLILDNTYYYYKNNKLQVWNPIEWDNITNKPSSYYTLPTATSSVLGGVKSSTTGTTANRDYAVEVKTDGTMKVNVPWTDHTYTLAGLMGSTAIGSATKPVYWDGSKFTGITSYEGKATTAGTADKLGTSTIGSATQGIYLSSGTPTAMTYSLSATVNSGTANTLSYYSGQNAISSAANFGINTAASALQIKRITSRDSGIEVLDTDGSRLLLLGMGSGNQNHGIYSDKAGKWALLVNGTSVTLNGNATSASKVNNKLTIGGKEYDGSTAVSVSLTDLGLSRAMRFIGTTTSLADGATGTPTIASGQTGYAAANRTAGDVVLNTTNNYEYLWTGSAWQVLGPGGSYDVAGTAAGLVNALDVSDPTANGSGLTFIATASQTDGKISVTKKTVQDASTSQKGVLQFTAANTNTQLNQLTTGSSAPQDNDYFISQYAGGGTTTTTYHRRPVSALATYMKGKLIDVLDVASVGGTGKYISAISETDGKISATASDTSVSNAWAAGSTNGPTLSTTVNGVSGTAVAIPSASASASGVITTGAQTFAGVKTFNNDVVIKGGLNNYFVCTGTVATTKTVNSATHYVPTLWKCNSTVTVQDGAMITIKMPTAGHDYGVWLSVDNGTTYKPIAQTMQGTGRLTTHYPANSLLTLVYDSNHRSDSMFPAEGGTGRSNITGSWVVINGYNTDNIETYTEYAGETTGTVGLFANSILMRTSANRWDAVVTSSKTDTNKARNTTGFMIGSKIWWTSYTVAANTALHSSWRSIYSFKRRIDFRYSSNCGTTLTAGKPVYLVGTVTNGYFYLDATWWTQTIPTTKDGKVYVLVGGAYNTYQVDLYENNEWYWHDGTAFTKYGGAAAASTTLEWNTEKTIATIGGNDIKVKLPANPNTTYTIASGDANGQIKVTPSSGSAYNVSVKGLGSNAYTSTAYLPLSGGTMTDNISYNMNSSTQIPFKVYGGDANGQGISVGAGGATIVGSGESAKACEALLGATTEQLWLASDGDIHFYTNCQTIGNKVGVILNTSRAFYPNTNNTGSLGTSSYKWANAYATTFHGALDGKATTAGTADQTKATLTVSNNAATVASKTFNGSSAVTVTGDDLFKLFSATKSITVTRTWKDTGIKGADLEDGSYIIQAYVSSTGTGTLSSYQEYYTGMMSWFSTTTNSSDYDEILLHKAGHASNGHNIYLRTIRSAAGSDQSGRLKLQIAADIDTTVAASIVFKFRKMI